MKKIFLSLSFIFCCFNLFALEYVPNQLIFKTENVIRLQGEKTGLQSFDAFSRSRQIKRIKPIFSKNDNRYFVATFEEDIDWENIATLQFPGIEHFQPNYLNTFSLTPNDTYYDEQVIELENCNIPDAWNYTTGNSEIIVSVIDSGIHFDHPDLQNNIFINENEIPDDGIDNDGNGYIDDWRGWDFVDAPELYSIGIGDYVERDNDASDELNHGTHVSGIIAADANNNEGICGICWQVKLLAVRSGFKTIDGLGYLQDDDAAAGIIYSADIGADIINLSWGDVNYSQIIADACDYAYNQGSIIVASAGNEGSTAEHRITYPAKLSTTLCVGAVTDNLSLASFSSYGTEIDLVAPGYMIYSTFSNSSDNLYNVQSGTSMSAPYVASAAALLLSIDPNLNQDQVRSRLLSSCIDLGEEGKDDIFGYGLLDVQELLITNNTPQIDITYPQDNQAICDDVFITGTVCAPDFWRYNVKWTDAVVPTLSDWQDVDPAHTFYYDEVQNDTIAYFPIYQYFSSGSYKIKITIETDDAESYDLIRTIHIDQSPPEFNEDYAVIMKRYAAEIPEYYFQAVFDEKVFLEINIPPSSNYQLISPIADSILVCQVPVYYAGNQPINLRAINLAGLETFVDEAYDFQPDYTPIDIHSYEQHILGSELSAIQKTYDFNNNGKNEFIALDTSQEEFFLNAYEVHNNEIVTTHHFSESIWPHDLGNTNAEGMELLGILVDQPVVYETVNSDYPNTPIFPAEDAYGGNFIDYDNDGFDELALIRNVTIDQVSKRALQLFQRNGDEFQLEYTILNETPTSVKNTFVNKVRSGDFDDDGNPDILAADTDGDVIIFEKNASVFEMVWTDHLPIGEAYQLAVGDFTGDGLIEFCVGGYSYDPIDPNKSFTYFNFYKNNGEDNSYDMLDYISFSQHEQKNSIATTDLDGDEDDEIVISVPPNIYIVDYQNDEFVPIWKGDVAKTYQNILAVNPQSEVEDAYIIGNMGKNNEISSCLIKQSELFTGPPSPVYLEFMPIDSTTVHMRWRADIYDYFNIYKQQNDSTFLAATIPDHFYQDHELVSGDTVSYQITAVKESYDPAESLPTAWKTAIPLPKPNLISVKMISQYDLRLKFDREISSTASEIPHYFVNNDMGNPISANLLGMDKIVLLKFANPFGEFDQYTIYISGLSGITGVPLSTYYEFDYQEDTVAPKMTDVDIPVSDIVRVYFSEPLTEISAEDTTNYKLIFPNIDAQNEIINISYFNEDSSYVNIQLQENMKYTNQPYFLKAENIYDLAGNKISNIGNKIHFSLTDIKNLQHLIVYPNPLNLRKSAYDVVNFINFPLDKKGNIKIFDVNAELIYTQEIGPYRNSLDYFKWDCLNEVGQRVSSGMYFYIINMDDEIKRGKIAIIN